MAFCELTNGLSSCRSLGKFGTFMSLICLLNQISERFICVVICQNMQKYINMANVILILMQQKCVKNFSEIIVDAVRHSDKGRFDQELSTKESSLCLL